MTVVLQLNIRNHVIIILALQFQKTCMLTIQEYLQPGLLTDTIDKGPGINEDIFATDSAPYHSYCHTILSLVHLFGHEASQGGYWWTVIQLFD